MTNAHIAREFLKAIEAGDDAARFYAPDAVFHEHPNLLTPNGALRDITAIRNAAERGRKAVRDQRYEVHSLLSDGDQVALRVTWRATLNVALGKTPEGGQMTADFGLFLKFRDGRICEQHNYDCFQPF
jgi:predicted ester cyclase